MKFAIAMAASFLLGVLVTAAGVPMKVNYVGHEQVASTMVKGGQIVSDNGLVVLANRAVQRGAEMHGKTNHVFIIVDGEATFVTGGTLVNAKEIAPGQTRADGIEGGQSHHLSKGDVITIPANTPHWWKDTSKTGSVGYYAVNIEQ
ncbi:MAG TPA: cupin domain-containing protein [Vicinamibacterales bacterium]|nr:cupin domain-containing protein [Vicinamibacterales bacterium]